MTRQTMTRWLLALGMMLGTVLGCGEEDAPTEEERGDAYGIVGGEVNDFGKPTFGPSGAEELRDDGKSDSVRGRLGLPVSVDGGPTSVWEVRNQWEETDTPEARAEGMAWDADSGLTWEEKFERWVDSLERIDAHGSSRTTYRLTTPWGRTLPAPALECAEQAIFLRVAFAAWYGLPFYLEASDAEGGIYFGHFGMRREDGRFARTPNFRDRYADHTDLADAVRAGQDWPSDEALAGKTIPGSFDDAQPALGPNAHAGTYFDRVFLNKRVGHFLITTLAYFGSIHLADARNTFNVAPEHILPGDVLVERWQRTGIGHVLLVMRAGEAGIIDGQMRYEAEVASGSMPRRQPVWESPGASKRTFMLDEAGGPGYADMGGGLKRWRIARPVQGRWANVISAESRHAWIDSTDLEAIEARPAQFGELLVELEPEQKLDVLLDIIEAKREHLRRYPASCAARIAREDAFDGLYALMAQEFEMSAGEVDATYRRLEDYVFAELEYGASKTCCWNSSTADIYEIAMDLNLDHQQSAAMCAAPIVFKNRDDAGDGFALFAEYAAQSGRADQWVSWSADESCPQAEVAADTEIAHDHTPYCDLTQRDAPDEDTPMGMRYLLAEEAVAIPDNDRDGVTLEVAVAEEGVLDRVILDVAITHTYRGDLEIEVIHPDGASVIVRESGFDADDNLRETFEMPQFEGKTRAGTWRVVVRDTARLDTGTVDQAGLTLR